jgi:hypothetical protein
LISLPTGEKFSEASAKIDSFFNDFAVVLKRS